MDSKSYGSQRFGALEIFKSCAGISAVDNRHQTRSAWHYHLSQIESRFDNSSCFPEGVSLNLRASLGNRGDEVFENVQFDPHFEQEILIYGDDRHGDR
jgi:hypothetical protein